MYAAGSAMKQKRAAVRSFLPHSLHSAVGELGQFSVDCDYAGGGVDRWPITTGRLAIL